MKPPNIFTIFFTKKCKIFFTAEFCQTFSLGFQFSARLCRLLPKGRKNLQLIKVPSTLCSDASFASFQCLFLYSARHQHDSFQASPRTAAGSPTNYSRYSDNRQQYSRQSAAVFPTIGSRYSRLPSPTQARSARCALQRCSP